MSPPRGASSGSYAVGTAVSQITSHRAAVAQRRPDEHPARAVSPSTVPADGKPPEIQQDTLVAEDEVAGFKKRPVSADQWRSARTSTTSLRPDRAQKDQRDTVLGYASVDADHGERSMDDLRRQLDDIANECERRGLRLLEVVRERERPRQRPLERPGLGYALGRIAAGEASGLVVSELSRVTHSVPELGRVLEWLSRRHARLVVAVPGFDTYEGPGHLVLRTIVEISGWERQRLVERTRNGMRAARRKGPASVADNPQLRERIARMRAHGMTLQAIADELNAGRVPTVRGGSKWRPSSVQAAAGYRRPTADRTLELRSLGKQTLSPRHPAEDVADVEGSESR
jgi:DNA invertase Pin-like site-specific DNA recombinase